MQSFANLDEEVEFLEKSNKFYKEELTLAVKYLLEAKRQMPETTNSLVDDFLKKHRHLVVN